MKRIFKILIVGILLSNSQLNFAVTVNLSCSPTAGGTISSSGYVYTAHPKSGYQFAYWKNGSTKYTANPLDLTDDLTLLDAMGYGGGSFKLTAYFTQVTTYTITWKNYDGSTLTISQVEQGVKPTYSGSTPTRPSTAQYTYTFKGWTPAIVAASANTTYTATYTQTTRKYSITFVDADGAQIGSAQSVNYGSDATPPTSPTREGYTFAGWIGKYQNITEAATIYASYYKNTDASTVQPGALDGVFSVSATSKVYFSQGNLQYNAKAGTHACADASTKQGVWRFAEHQYDCIGSANTNVSSSYANWIDLFGWGTSGYHNSSDTYNTQYNPYSTSTSTLNEQYNYYGYGPSKNQADTNLINTSANFDWGVYNAISNGGNTPNSWRTLTWQEFEYLLYKRTNAKDLKGVARVNGVNGAILLPDNWTCPDGITFITRVAATNHADSFAIINNYSLAQWKILENTGAVFLPCAGGRSVTTVVSLQTWGNYWTTTSSSDSRNSYIFRVTSNSLSCNAGNKYRCNGFSVRLVTDVLIHTITFVDADGNVIGTPQIVQCGQSATPPTPPTREGYTFVGWIGKYQNVTEDAIIHPSYYKNTELSTIQPGALDGVFSVSATNKVVFSQGNLQYCTTSETWRFANHQYDYIGKDNVIDPQLMTKTGTEEYRKYYWEGTALGHLMDLFAWSTDNATLSPWGIYPLNYKNSTYTNLLTSVNFIDWGANLAGDWYTMSRDEWNYILTERPNAANLQAIGTVNGVNGCIILPDNWTLPQNMTFIPGIATVRDSISYSTINNYSLNEWQIMENAGAVFLPSGGDRVAYKVNLSNIWGTYWTSSKYDQTYGTVLSFITDLLEPGYSWPYIGRNVRLVHGIQIANISVNSSDVNAGTVKGGGEYISGTTQQISANPAECYRFVRWSDNNTNNPRTVTVTGNATYTAIFEKVKYTIRTESDNISQGKTKVEK